MSSLFSLSPSRLSTKPGSAHSTSRSHSLTAGRPFLASNTVWRFRLGVRSYCPTMMKSSMGACPVSSAQVQYQAPLRGCAHSARWGHLEIQLVVFQAYPSQEPCKDHSPTPHSSPAQRAPSPAPPATATLLWKRYFRAEKWEKAKMFRLA